MSSTRLGRYTLKKRLGAGGMAEVWEAFDETLHRTVAVKVIRPAISGAPEFVERFLREARVVANLEHPNIVPVYDFGNEGETAYLVMPLVPGGTLKDRMRGPMDPAAALDAIAAIAAALDHAHGKSVLHRDVKPTNVLVDQIGRLVLADFGLAKSTMVSSELTSTGMVVGTPVYMSPEQALGQQVDGRSDQYALAVLAFELLTGRIPYVAATPIAFLQQHLHAPPPAATSVNRALPPAVDAALARGLAKRPEERYDSCTALAAAIGEALGITLATARWRPTAGGRLASSSVPAPTPIPATPAAESESATIVHPSSGGVSRASASGAATRATGQTSPFPGPVTPPPLPRAVRGPLPSSLEEPLAELPRSGTMPAPALPSESRRMSILPLLLVLVAVGALIGYQIYTGRKTAGPGQIPVVTPAPSSTTPPGAPIVPVATPVPTAVPTVEPTLPPITIREVGATPTAGEPEPTRPPRLHPTAPPPPTERPPEDRARGGATPAAEDRRGPMRKGEKRTGEATVPFRPGERVPVGAKVGDATILSVEVKDMPDDSDYRKAEKDPERTHKITVTFTYANADEEHDYKCDYGVTLLDGAGRELGSGEQGRSLNKGERSDTNRMSVKGRTADFKSVRSMRLKFRMEAD